MEKKTINKVKQQPTDSENLCPMYNRKGTIHCNISLNSLNYREKNWTSILKNGQKNSLKITFKWPLKIWKDVQPHSLLENANQSNNEISFHAGQNGHHQKSTNNKC